MAAKKKTGAANQAFLDGLGQAEVRTARVADRGEAALQHLLEDHASTLSHIEGRHSVDGGQIRGYRSCMHVRVAEPRHEHAAAKVDLAPCVPGLGVVNCHDPAVRNRDEAGVVITPSLDVEDTGV
jgi:hypothetical protein